MTLLDGEYEPLEDGLPALLPALLSVAAPYLALLSPHVSALTAAGAVLGDFFSRSKAEERVRALKDEIVSRSESAKLTDDGLARKLASPAAKEALTVAVLQAVQTPRLEKVRRFGAVVGAQLATETPDWDEAVEFLRDLEQVSDTDIEALRILWRVQQSAYRVISTSRREMSTNANDYTRTWTGVLSHVEKAGISKDDWYSRCARLGGFGLTVPVQPNPSFQGPDAMCYRLTGRAVRLLKLLGRNVDPSAYPSWRYHATKPAVVVNDEDEDSRLGEGWADSPAAFQKD